MTKADIVSNIVEETGLERVEALKAVEAFMTTIKASLTKTFVQDVKTKVRVN